MHDLIGIGVYNLSTMGSLFWNGNLNSYVRASNQTGYHWIELDDPYMLVPLLLGALFLERICSECYKITLAEVHVWSQL